MLSKLKYFKKTWNIFIILVKLLSFSKNIKKYNT